MTPLGAHEGDEVERAQVNLEKLLQAVRLDRYLWTPRAVALLEIQPGGREEKEDKMKNNGGWMFILQQEREKREGGRKNWDRMERKR